MTHDDITVRALCKIMNDAKEPDVIKRAYNVWLWLVICMPSPGKDCFHFALNFPHWTEIK